MTEEKSKKTKKTKNLQEFPLFATLSSLLKNYFLAIIGAAFLAMLLRVFVVEAFRIPGDFMAPTLLPGDHIFVNKLAYSGKIFSTATPKRGDIVVFSFSSEPNKEYIKRVVGLPGDEIEIRDGALLVNRISVSKQLEGGAYEESLDGRTYLVNWTNVTGDDRNMIAVKVPEGKLFLLGDNRANRQDSRSWGYIPTDSLKGRAWLVWFSAGAGAETTTTKKKEIRWSRFLTRIK